MQNTSPTDPSGLTLCAVLFAPLRALLAAEKLDASRSCLELDDTQFLELGVQRVIDAVQSGRDFLQRLREIFSMALGRSNFFSALNSLRRLSVAREINVRLTERHLSVLRKSGDALNSITQLAGREVWAGDGTCFEHACHDKRDYKGRPIRVRHFFSIDMRSGWLRLLRAFSSAAPNRHEIKSLKLEDGVALRMSGQRGAIHVYDRSIIDFRFWSRQRRAHGVYSLAATNPISARFTPSHSK